MGRDNLTERLVHAGTAPDAEIDELIEATGLDTVVQALVAEIVFRCERPENVKPVNVALELTHGQKQSRVVLQARRGEPVRVLDDPDPVIWSLLRIRVTDMIRRLYGRTSHRRNGDFHNAFLQEAPSPESMFFELPEIMRSAALATGTVISGCASYQGELGALSLRHDSDKWASFHWYTPHYERHFAPFREEAVRVLEIGIGGYDEEIGGGSLKMWKRYFHRGLIVGLDIFDKTELTEPRLTALKGDQNDPEFLVAMAREHGPFDIIIDDGSHMNEHVHTSFHTLFPLLRDGGVYVIEDLQTSYFPSFGGSSGRQAAPHTSVGLVKGLLDDLHHQEFDQPVQGALSPTQAAVTGVHAYHNVVFIEKGVNGEDGLPAWMNEAAWEALGATDT
ncbi:hypothetical protein HEK616_47570 [Streptomyces nigrescens]|uniref:Methyltransferase MycE N-terminal domain-containing protein n=2 Tax=Streptomyces TaxID=1883 RepID=A0ABM7ZY13_STRNI|nr:class I SAM-dependent methyltransferase [Streptomyces nigrescens]MEE4421615.1 class I SAM-dependent methyltransferase [Streptomyces sp. DSM 41528]BDM71270.1 hypothetical protein HEK616_47570 [Streptomyces nigrescens]